MGDPGSGTTYSCAPPGSRQLLSPNPLCLTDPLHYRCDRPYKDRDSVDAIIQAKGKLVEEAIFTSPKIDLFTPVGKIAELRGEPGEQNRMQGEIILAFISIEGFLSVGEKIVSRLRLLLYSEPVPY
jgi:hypothetical protein